MFTVIIFLGLSELGSEVVKVFIVPKVKAIGDRLENCSSGDKIAVGHIKHLILVSIQFMHKYF